MSFVTSGCVSVNTSAADFCTAAQPIYIDEGDAFSDQTARVILRHNKLGRAMCGW